MRACVRPHAQFRKPSTCVCAKAASFLARSRCDGGRTTTCLVLLAGARQSVTKACVTRRGMVEDRHSALFEGALSRIQVDPRGRRLGDQVRGRIGQMSSAGRLQLLHANGRFSVFRPWRMEAVQNLQHTAPHLILMRCLSSRQPQGSCTSDLGMRRMRAPAFSPNRQKIGGFSSPLKHKVAATYACLTPHEATR